MNNTLKKSLSLIIAVLLCLSCFGIMSFAANDSVLTYTVNTDGTAMVSKCSASAKGAVVVPSVVTVKGKSYNVTEIGNSAFENCTKITSISIAEGITTIDSRAFANCTALTDVYVPESLIFCQYTAFNGCEAVIVHCYSSNYQFFTVYGINQNLKIDVLDSNDVGSASGSDSEMTNAIVELIKKIILAILSIFMIG